MQTVGRLAKRHGISRSTLLYYDSIGLLRPSARGEGEYRHYCDADEARLERILGYRRLGFSLDRIRRLLDAPASALRAAFLRRLDELRVEAARLREKQKLLVGLLEGPEAPESLEDHLGLLDKDTLVALLDASGVGPAERDRLHEAFEQSAPGRHQAFLEFLGMEPDEIAAVRAASLPAVISGNDHFTQSEQPCS